MPGLLLSVPVVSGWEAGALSFAFCSISRVKGAQSVHRACGRRRAHRPMAWAKQAPPAFAADPGVDKLVSTLNGASDSVQAWTQDLAR